jgi:hypothetical protein
MFVVDRDSYVRTVTAAMLRGQPLESFADACRRHADEEAAAKVVSLADWRARLRPPVTTET